MIRMEMVEKRYDMGRSQVAVLRQVSLHIRPGQFAAIVGPSGSGKSTLMNLIGCLDRPTGGAYYLDGENTARLNGKELSRLRREKLGFVFQGFQLLPRLTALENTALPLLLAGVGEKERISRAAQALDRVGLGERLRHLPNQLSGGQQQRAAIARALIQNPPVLLADEPTGSLDGESAKEVFDMFLSLHREGRTLVLITHDPRLAVQAQVQYQVREGQVNKVISGM